MHNRIRDTLALILQQTATAAGLASCEAAVATEPTSILPQFPTLRPADVALHVPPGTRCPYNTILFDVTHTSLVNIWSDPNTPNPVVYQHEISENRKFHGKTTEVAQAILQQNQTLIPCTFDPGGSLGPVITHFLFGKPNPDLPYLKPTSTSPRIQLTSEAAKILSKNTLTAIPHPGLLHIANHKWQESSPGESFTRHHHVTLPSHWAIQVLGNNLLLALGHHLDEAITNTMFLTNTPPTLAVAAAIPRKRRPRTYLPPIYYYYRPARE